MNLKDYFAYMDLLPAGKEMMGKMIAAEFHMQANMAGTTIVTRRHVRAEAV